MTLEQKLPPELYPIHELKHACIEPARFLVHGYQSALEFALFALPVSRRVVHASWADTFLEGAFAVADLLAPGAFAEAEVVVCFGGEEGGGVYGAEGVV